MYGIYKLMYITAVPHRNSPPALLLRESFRDGDKVRTRTLANLTSWAPERIEALRRALKGDLMASRGTCNPSVAPALPSCLSSNNSPGVSGCAAGWGRSAGRHSSCC